MKTCKICKTTKALEEFNNKPGGKLGKDTRCKVCQSAYSKHWREANHEVQLEKSREYKRNNREVIRQREREYYRRTTEQQSLRKKK